VKGIFDQLEWDPCIIFTSTKKGTDELQRLLKREGLKAASIHGDRSQDERNKALAAFKNKQVPIIVATDVLARGIDIKEVSIIINYDVPNNTDDYVHRIGRTARYDKSGIAITFITQRDKRTFRDIDKIKENSIKKLNVPPHFNHPGQFSWEDHFEKKETGRREVKQESAPSESSKKRDNLPPRPTQKKSKKEQPSTRSKSGHQDSKKDKAQSKSHSQKESRQAKKEKQRITHSSSSKNKTVPVEEKPTEQKQQQKRQQKKDINLPPVIEKAVDRNKRARKPAKGVWGIIKSFIPKIRKN